MLQKFDRRNLIRILQKFHSDSNLSRYIKIIKVNSLNSNSNTSIIFINSLHIYGTKLSPQVWFMSWFN